MRTLFLLLFPLWIGSVYAAEIISAEGGAEETPLSAEQQQSLGVLLALEKDVEAEPMGETTFYSPSNLYKYINGAAEAYLVNHFEGLGHRVFKKGAAEVTVDIYDMGNPKNAFGIYSLERSPQNHFVEMGSQGFLDEFLLNFFQGAFYVKISAFSEEKDVSGVLKAFAQAVSKKVGGEKGMPEELGLLPERDKVANSEQLQQKSPLGFQYLEPAWTAVYKSGDKESTLLLSDAGSPEGATERVRKLRAFVEKSGEAKDVSDLGSGAFQGKSRYQGDLLAMPAGQYAVIMKSPADNALDLLKEAAKKIEAAK